MNFSSGPCCFRHPDRPRARAFSPACCTPDPPWAARTQSASTRCRWNARARFYLTNSYFVPDKDFRNMLCAAATRGVDTRVLTVGNATDIKPP